MGFLEVAGLTKRYRGEAAPCVRELDLSVERGEMVVLLGASGCGKSTVLKCIAGLEDAQAGTVSIDGEAMDGIAPEKRPVAMVFQKALLFRNMTVEQNVNFAPRVNRAMPKAELARKTSEMLELVGLGGMEKKKATALSGGQEQRVSLARALMVEPKLLLLDEPLSALDAALRETMQDYIRALTRDTGTTMLLVTHDQQEAIALADRIAVMHDGRIVQLGSPREFYERPSSKYVASFFGWKNFTPAMCENGKVTCALGSFELPGLGDAPASGLLVMRPEAVANVGAGALEAAVRTVTYRGTSVSYRVECVGSELDLSLPASSEFSVGERFSFDLSPDKLWYVADDGDIAYSEDERSRI
ncbi:MAG: ABC transporter ATP-binding protein [Eggerthellaceae bacterium]|nr:ABC transporter ATP-binding protein [Eggerthellaceae bacterium]